MNQQFYAPTSSYYPQQATTTAAATDQSSQSYGGGEASSTSGAGQTSQTSISDMLAAASERVLERCGLEYDETAGMYYDANSALFYDQVCIIIISIVGGRAPDNLIFIKHTTKFETMSRSVLVG